MATVNTQERIIQVDNFDFRYSADDFVNADSADFSDPRMNRAWVIHNAGTVLAIVFAEYYAYCDQDALDEACDRDKLDSLLCSYEDLKDYEVGTDSEGYPEYEGIIYLGNASEPFACETLDLFCIKASLFKDDPAVMQVILDSMEQDSVY